MTRRTEQAAARNADQLLDLPNVVGTAGGKKLLVLVTRKVPLSMLAAGAVVPDRVDGVETDVLEVGDIEALALYAGASIGLRDYGTGTLGAVVEDHDGRRYALTNNHVGAASNQVRVLTAVHSPGPADGLGREFGQLGRFEPIRFPGPNLVDAALIQLDDDTAERTHPRLALDARPGWKVSKVGRTSGRNTGTVLARNATLDIGFGQQGTARFVGQTVTSHMLEPGDSGSVLTTVGGFACGLCFAGSDRISIANPIRTVLRTLGIRT